MNLAAWQALSRRDPATAARELHRRIRTVPPSQRTAIFAWSPDEAALATRFAAAPAAAPLAGIPYALKDLFHVAGLPTRAGGTLPADTLPTPATDGDLAHTLATAGAVLAAKTHLHEFAYGLTGENAHHGDVEHPRFPGRTSGGSSSGSAAAVAARIVPFAIGTDTGGSIRIPAAFCGLFGLRLTPHHRWIADAFPLAPSYDTAGWFTADAGDMRTLCDVLIGLGHAEREPRGAYLDFAALGQPADADVATAVSAAAATFAEPLTGAARETLVRLLPDLVETYAIGQSTEAFAVHRDWLDRHRDHYEPAVWERIDRGRRWTDAQRVTAAARQTALRLFWTEYFLAHDFLILPATPFPALTKADCTLAHRNRLLALTAPASLGGLPVLTVPIALASGLSTGLQLIINSPHSPALAWALARCATC